MATHQSAPASDDELAKKGEEPSRDYVPLDPYGVGQRPGSPNGASEPSTQSVKLTLCVFRCGNCGATLKAPELIGDFRYGEFLLRSRGSSRLAYLSALDGPAGETFNEVSELLEQSKRAKRLSDHDRADLAHEIVGSAFDEDADGFPFSMKEPPECPECGSHHTAFVEEPDPPENVDVDVAVLTTTKWQKLGRAEKKDFVLEILTGL